MTAKIPCGSEEVAARIRNEKNWVEYTTPTPKLTDSFKRHLGELYDRWEETGFQSVPTMMRFGHTMSGQFEFLLVASFVLPEFIAPALNEILFAIRADGKDELYFWRRSTGGLGTVMAPKMIDIKDGLSLVMKIEVTMPRAGISAGELVANVKARKDVLEELLQHNGE